MSRSWKAAIRLLALLLVGHAPGAAQHQEHDAVRRGVEAGQLVPISEIRQRLLQRLPGHQHIGTEFDPVARIYRLKFMRSGHVLWLDVDARTGRIIGRASP